MKNAFSLLTLLIISTISQVMLPGILKMQVCPDLVLLIILGVAQQKRPAAGTISGFIGGMFQDNLSGALLGTGAFTKTLIGFLASKSIKKFYHERLLFQFAFAFVFTVFHELIFLSLKQLSEPALSLVKSLQTTVLPAAFYNTLLGPPIFWLVRRVSD